MHESTAPDQQWELADDAATMRLGQRIGAALDDGMVVYLHGPLGAGKTSLARGLLGALGVGERIKSPTYSLVEGYSAGERPAWHLDLYRIADPGELEWLGLDVLSDPAAVVLIEWPQRGAGALPAADVHLHLNYFGSGRQARIEVATARGQRLLRRLAAHAQDRARI